MKNALILHGTDATSQDNWFPWLQKKLQESGWKVWVPDLPQAEKPNLQRYNDFIFSSDWVFDKDSILIGHSSGAVAILGLLQKLPKDTVVDTAVLVGSFKDDLGWDSLGELFEESFDFEKIKQQAKRFIFIHSDNDPFCPLEHAQYLSKKLGGELMIEKGAQHFSIGKGGPEYTKADFVLRALKIK